MSSFIQLQIFFRMVVLSLVGLLGPMGEISALSHHQVSHVRRYSLEDFMTKSTKRNFSFSPDGKYIAYLAPAKDKHKKYNLYLQDSGFKEKPRCLTFETVEGLGWYGWHKDRLLFFKDMGEKDKEGKPVFHLVSIDLYGKNLKDHTPDLKVNLHSIGAISVSRPEEVFLLYNEQKPEAPHLYSLNLVAGEQKKVLENSGDMSSAFWDRAGQIRVISRSYKDGRTGWLHRDHEKEPFRPLFTLQGETFRPHGFAEDGQHIYALSNRGRDKVALVLVHLKTGREQVVFEHPDVDVNGVEYGSDSEQTTPIAVNFTKEKFTTHWLNPEWTNFVQDLGRDLPGDIGNIIWDKSRTKFIIQVASDRFPTRFYLFDSVRNKWRNLEEAKVRVPEKDRASVQPIEYRARDGRVIHGYITLPRHREQEKNLPMIVYVHGGPWLRDVWAYDIIVQFLAHRGYAVLQVNFRGSTGYGRRFMEASFKQWGRSMQDDITDGVLWAIKEGIADPKRIAIGGASYGGYAALAGAMLTPHLYAAVGAMAAPTNLLTFTKADAARPYAPIIQRMVGHPLRDAVQLAAVSPALHADKIVAPVFLAHSDDDPRVSKTEAEQMLKALEWHRKIVEYVALDKEGHLDFKDRASGVKFIERLMAFLDKYMPAQ